MIDRYLFRGKCEDNGEWRYGDLIRHDTRIHPMGKTIIGGNDSNYIIDPSTIGQCTGLRDKNGALIFEGDIVRMYPKYYGGNEAVKGYGRVEFSYEYAGGWIVAAGENKCNLGNRAETFEVVSNVHDNPELLRGEQ